jgi:hypothetical protein
MPALTSRYTSIVGHMGLPLPLELPLVVVAAANHRGENTSWNKSKTIIQKKNTTIWCPPSSLPMPSSVPPREVKLYFALGLRV